MTDSPGRAAPRPVALSDRTLATFATVLMVVVAGILFVQMWSRAHRADGYDLTSYLLSARALLDGTNPYRTPTPFPILYPLFLPLLLIPLAVIPYAAANVVWFAIGCGAALLSIAWTFGLAETVAPSPARAWARLAGLFLLLVPVIQSNLLNGQVNLVVLLACVAFFRADRRGWTALACAALAAAIALKLVPAILCAYLLVAGRWRALAAVIVLTIVFAMSPALVVGDRVVAWYDDYVRHVLPDHFARSGVSHDPPVAWARMLVALVVVGGVMALHFRSRRLQDRSGQVRIGALYLAAALVISPIPETHHLALLFPGVVVGVARWPRRPSPAWTLQLVLLLGFFATLFLGAAVRHGPFSTAGAAAVVLMLAAAQLEANRSTA